MPPYHTIIILYCVNIKQHVADVQTANNSIFVAFYLSLYAHHTFYLALTSIFTTSTHFQRFYCSNPVIFYNTHILNH